MSFVIFFMQKQIPIYCVLHIILLPTHHHQFGNHLPHLPFVVVSLCAQSVSNSRFSVMNEVIEHNGKDGASEK